eukprot:1892914-Alexandrium_andersonii.AAC.1
MLKFCGPVSMAPGRGGWTNRNGSLGGSIAPAAGPAWKGVTAGVCPAPCACAAWRMASARTRVASWSCCAGG